MRKTLFSLLFFISIILWGQDFPHVSEINAEIRNNLIRITWIDSPEARGPVYIFRSARPFHGTIPANIRPIIVSYGTQSYIDDTDDIGNLYYFIAASDTAGRRYDGIISRVNYTNVNFDEPEEQELPSSVITYSEPEYIEDVFIEGISNLRAELDGEKVTITFNNSNPQRKIILYRSTQPVRRPLDLINAVIIQPGTGSVFTDYPVPGQASYYAIIYEDEVSGGNITINPGNNTTITAVIVANNQSLAHSMRPTPLPELTLSDIQGSFLHNQINQIPLGADSVNLLRNTPLPRRERQEPKRPRVFVLDLQAPAGGEDSALFQIVKNYFEPFDWENAHTALRHFLSLPRSKEVEARARFYLAQSLYYTGNYRESLLEFLSFRTHHEVEANIWIDAVLEAMVN